MSLILDGSLGVTVNAGTAALPAIVSTTGTADTGLWFPAADTVAASTGGTERLRIDSSGNVGIGISSPATKLDLLTPSATAVALRAGNSVSYAEFQVDASGYSQLIAPGGVQIFNTNGAERARIDSSGNVGIGTTSPTAKLQVNGSMTMATANWFSYGTDNTFYSDSSYGLVIKAPATSNFIAFRSSNDTERLRIDSSGGLILAGSTAQKATGTTWSNPSDKRIKDNIRDYSKGLTELMQVRVREWEYNGKGGTVEGTKGLGVVADEVMTVLPNTVENYNAKLNVDDEETTAIKKFDATEITWLLVKTVQEQQALIVQLQADVAALKDKP